MMSQKQLRCAIYTRKSTSEGLDQDFNSLDAQREACTAYIKSQRHEGWKLVPTRYDDGGLSGATMERPALARLLDEIRARRVDVVVVYKVDRLTRSLSDFAKMVEVFDAHEASFVSVTQQFNTTNSMGRLTLNVLLSFAQFEREVTAERIRDKIAASKRKGMWMGGVVPLGYDSVEKRLVVNEEEAAVVRRVFELYDQLGTVQAVKAEADRIGLLSKRRGSAPGRSFTRGHLYKLLGNPVYVGDVRHGDRTYEGEQDPIIDRDLWNRVQQRLKANAVTRGSGRRPSQTLLGGLVFTGADQRLVPTHSNRRGRRYRYYSTRADDHPSADGSSRVLRFPAFELDTIVCDALSRGLRDGSTLSEAIVHLQQQPCASLRALLECAEDFAQQLSTAEADTRRELLRQLVQRIEIGPDCLRFTIRPCVLNDFRRSIAEERSPNLDPGAEEFLILKVPAQLPARQHGSGTAVFSGVRPRPRFDMKLIRAVAEGKAWYERIKSGEFPTLRALAKAVGRDRPDVGRRIRLAFLAPDIVTAIVAGEQPNTLTIGALLRDRDIPLSWAEQRRLFGFRDPGDASR